MERVFILYTNFINENDKSVAIGGVETYITALIDVIKENKMIPIIMQYSKDGFTEKFKNTDVIGIKTNENWSVNKKSKFLFEKCNELMNVEKDIIIVAAHSMGVRNKLNNVIGIQHGITFDIVYNNEKNIISSFISDIKRVLQGYNAIIKSKRFNRLVAVDYNFLNWARTMPGFRGKHIKVIPNFVECLEFEKESNDNIKIIFARRFQKYRGTRLFSNVIIDLLEKYKNIQVTFAGEGPEEEYLKDLFKNEKRVKFIKYSSEDSLVVHKSYDIAVIPTIGSEGTSLSLLEAMASRCSVVATNVGGMTNIILDNYNGLLVDPDERDLYKGIEKLILDNSLRERLSNNAYLSVSNAFNYQLWNEKWTEVLKEFNYKNKE